MRKSPFSSRFSQLLHLTSALGLLSFSSVPAAAADWDGDASDTLWSSSINWLPDGLPATGDTLQFNFPAAAFIHLDGNRLGAYSGLNFSGGGNIVFGAAGASNVLTLSAATPNITVASGTTVQMNASITGPFNFSGGGTVVMNNFFAPNGNITVDGAGTTLKALSHAPLAHVVGGLVGTRGDIPTLGTLAGAAETITLTNGGGLQFAGYGLNPDSASKNIVLGTGGGVLDVRNGVVQLDDGNQVTQAAGVAGQITKKGAGRLLLFGNATGWALTGGSVTEAGFLEFNQSASAFTAAASHTVNGGVFGLGNTTTAFNFNTTAVTLNGGSLGVNGTDHRLGSNTVTSTLTLNSGNLLGADYLDGRTARAMRINSVLEGSGTINVLGGAGAGTGTPALGNYRIVFQRAPATGSTFSGRFVLNDSTGIENNPLNDSGTGTGITGNALGKATVEFKGTNTALDLRDNGTGSNTTLAGYNEIDLVLTNTRKGSTSSLAVTRSTGSNTGSTFVLGDLTIGSQYFDINAQNQYRAAFSGIVTINGNATLATRANGGANGSIQFNTAVNEDIAGRSLSKVGAGQMNALNSINVTTLNLVQGILSLQGPDGAIGLGKGNAATLNTSINGNLVLDDNTQGVASGNRLHSSLAVNMHGGTLTLQSGAGGSDQTVENLSLVTGFNTFNAVANSSASVLQLGNTTTLTRSNSAVANFTGTTLGGAGNSGRILIGGQATTPFLGGWAVVTSGGTNLDFAAYDATNGVSAFSAYTAGDLAANYTTGNHIKKTNNAATTLGAASIGSLNIQLTTAMPASTETIGLGGAANLLRIETGGIVTSGTQPSYIDHFTTAANKGQITAGTSADSLASLYITNNAALYTGARLVDNGTAALTVVKSGTGILYLSNNSAAAGTNNTFTGGLVINSGEVRIYGATGAGTTLDVLSSNVSLAGGRLTYNSASTSASGHTSTRSINVTASGSTLSGDNNIINAAGADADGSTSDKKATFAALNFTAPASGDGAPTLTFGGFNSTDMIFQTVSLANTPILNLGIASGDANSFIQFNQLTGSSDLIITQTGTTFNTSSGEYLILGSGTGDTTANTYSGDIVMRGGRLLLNKANNTAAITGDLYINGGTVSWNGTGRANQMASTSKVYLMAGNLGQADEGTTNGLGNDYDALVHELIMTGGQLNTGRQTFTVNKATISGGTIDVQGISNLGATLTLNNTELLAGAPNLNLKGDAVTDFTELVLGGDYFRTTGQNITFFSTPNLFAYGSRVTLNTDVTVGVNSIAGHSYSSGINIANSRELNLNAYVDLGGGIRNFDIAENAYYTIQPNLINGGFTKSGLGTMVLSSFLNQSTFAGNVTVNQGTLVIRNNSSLGTAAGGTTVVNGATLEVDSSLTIADNLSLSGTGAADKNAALLSYRGANTFTGSVTINGPTALSTYATSIVPDSSARPAGLVTAFSRSELRFTQAIGGTGTLLLRGDGHLYLDGGATHTGGLSVDTSSIVYLGGTSTYTGTTDISAGVLRTSTALGTTTQGTRILGGGTLQLTGNVNLGSESIELHGAGHNTQRGALVNYSGNNTVGGAITLVTDAQNPSAVIHSIDGLLSIVGNINGSTTPNLVLSGPGNGSISGSIATGAGTLTKRGSGKWTLAGATANTFTGATIIEGGTLEVDTASNKLSDTAALNFNGGDLSLTGSGTETVNGINLNAGGAEIALGSATLDVGAINRTTGATVNFAAAGNLTSSASNTNGILGAYATVGGRDWASVNGSTVTALSTYTTLFEDTNVATGTPAATPTLAATNNLLINRTQQNVSTTAISANSLKITTGLGTTQKNLNVALASGGILYDGTPGSTFGIAGTGTLSSGTGEHIFHIHEGTLDVGMIIAGNNGLTKDGTGTLLLNTGNTFTGNININSGTLAIVGGTAVASVDPTSLGAIGARNVTINGGAFSVIAGNYDPSATTKSFIIGSDGGTIHVGGGDSIYTTTNISRMVLNDAGQFAGTGTFTKTGDGRLEMAGTYDFTGDVVVQDGILIAGATSLGGRLPNQTITVERGATLALGASDFDGTLNLNDGSTYIVNGNGITNGFNGLVNINGSVSTYLQNIGTLSQNASVSFNNRVTLGAGSIWDIYGRDAGTVGNTGGGQLLLNGPNDIAGTVRINANALVVASNAGSLGNATNRANVELAGPNARLMLRENSTADFNFNLSVKANSVLSLHNAGANSGHFFSINNLNIADQTIFTLNGGNAEQLHVSGVTTFAGTSLLNFASSNVNAVFREVVGGNNIGKLGLGNVFLTGNTGWTGTYTQYLGNTQLLQSGTLTGISELIIKGSRFYIDNSQGSYNINRLSDTLAVTMYGGEFISSGNETVGALTVYGSTDIRNGYATATAGSNGTNPHVLTFAGDIVNARKLGGTIDFRSESAGTLGGDGVNPRVVFTGQATNTFLGGGIVNGNDWARYDTTVNTGSSRGVLAMNTYLTNTAETAWTTATHLNIDNLNPVLTASRSLLSLRFNTSTARTITLGTNNLNIVSGGILVTTTGGTHIIGANTTDIGELTAGGTPDGKADELFIHLVNGTPSLTINARVANNGTDPLAVVKASGGTLTLSNPNNSFSGGLYINEGIVAAPDVTSSLGAANSDIIFQGGTLNLRHDNGGAANGTLNYHYNILTRANSTLTLDRTTGTSSTITGSTMVFRKLGIDNSTLTVRNNINTGTNASNYAARFTEGAEFKGVAILDLGRNGTGGTGNVEPTMTVTGAVTGDGTFYKNGGGNLVFGDATNTDAIANTWSTDVVMNAGNIELRKTTGTTAIGGDLIMNGGTLTLFNSNQIADTTNIVMNNGIINFRANAETIASLILNGGQFRTNNGGTAVAGTSNVTVTGDVTVNGTTVTDSIRVDALTTLDIQGTLYLKGPMARIEVIDSGTISTKDIEMTGSTFRVGSGSGVSNLILNGDVDTFASEQSSIINGDNDSDSFLNLGKTAVIFNVFDGGAIDDLIVSPRIRNATGIVGGFTKTGAGSMVIAGSGATNTNQFTGVVNVDQGRLDLRKEAGATAISGSGLNIASEASVRQLNSNQITDTTALTVNGTYDLDYGNASDTVGAISGTNANAKILLGPGSALTTNFASTAGVVTYAGQILGTGASNDTTTTGGIIKTGTGSWQLTGNSEFAGNTIVNAGELAMMGIMKGNTTYAKTGATLSGAGTLANVILESGATLKPGGVADTTNVSIGTLNIAGDLSAASASTTRMQVQGATTITNFGNFDIGSASYIAFITNEANTNNAWKSSISGTMDHILITGTEGNNGDFTLASGAQFTINALGGYTGGYGDVFNLIDWTGIGDTSAWAAANTTYLRNGGDINDLDLPTLSAGLLWDTRLFASHGTLVVVPEPGRALLLMAAMILFIFRRRR